MNYETKEKENEALVMQEVGGKISDLETFTGALKTGEYPEERWGQTFNVYLFSNGNRYTKDEEGYWTRVND